MKSTPSLSNRGYRTHKEHPVPSQQVDYANKSHTVMAQLRRVLIASAALAMLFVMVLEAEGEVIGIAFL